MAAAPPACSGRGGGEQRAGCLLLQPCASTPVTWEGANVAASRERAVEMYIFKAAVSDVSVLIRS